MKKPKHFGWKFDGTQYVATITDNPIAPNTMISYASCNCEGNIFHLHLWGGYLHEPEIRQSFNKNILVFSKNIIMIFSEH